MRQVSRGILKIFVIRPGIFSSQQGIPTWLKVKRGSILLQQILQTICTTSPTLGNLPEDLDDGRKDVAAAVGQDGGRLDVVHLGDLVVQFDEVGGGVSASDGRQAVFDNAAGAGLCHC